MGNQVLMACSRVTGVVQLAIVALSNQVLRHPAEMTAEIMLKTVLLAFLVERFACRQDTLCKWTSSFLYYYNNHFYAMQ